MRTNRSLRAWRNAAAAVWGGEEESGTIGLACRTINLGRDFLPEFPYLPNRGLMWTRKRFLSLVKVACTTQWEHGRFQGSAGTGAVRRRKVGDVEVEFATPGSGVGGFAATGYTATAYGQEYLALLKKNFPSRLVV